VVTLKENYFKIISAFFDVPTEINKRPKLLQNNFRGLLQLMNIFFNMFNVAEIMLK